MTEGEQIVWFYHSLARLAAEVEPGDEIQGIAIGVQGADGMVRHYTLTPALREVQRQLIPREAWLMAKEFQRFVIDITPPV